MNSGKGVADSKKQTAKKIASLIKNPSALKPKNQLQSSQAKRFEWIRVYLLHIDIWLYVIYWFSLNSRCRDAIMKNCAGTPNLALENQAIKRQKLDGGRSRQVNPFFFLFSSVYLLHYYCFGELYLNSSFFFSVSLKNLRFLTSNLKTCPTSRNWVLPVAVPIYVRQLLKLAKMRERLVVSTNFFYRFFTLPTGSLNFFFFLILSFMFENENQRHHLSQWHRWCKSLILVLETCLCLHSHM